MSANENLRKIWQGAISWKKFLRYKFIEILFVLLSRVPVNYQDP